ncbi:MAG: hypothetical protein R3E79_16550 [Caldilineaceae bacterium]
MKISAFPKCYMDDICVHHTMTVFDWIEMAQDLGAEGLEMYDGFLASLDNAYLDSVGEAIAKGGHAMPMLCCSPDLTNPDADGRKRAIEREAEMIRATRRLRGTPGPLSHPHRSALPGSERAPGGGLGERSGGSTAAGGA